jgi:hypothetical protein
LVSGVRGSAAESGEEMELRVGVPTKPDDAVRDMGVDGASLEGDDELPLLLPVVATGRAAMSAAVMPEEMPKAEVRRSM